MKPHTLIAVLLLFMQSISNGEEHLTDSNSYKDTANYNVSDKHSFDSGRVILWNQNYKPNKGDSDAYSTGSESTNWDKWLTVLTLGVIGVSIWQVVESRKATRQELRAYVFLIPSEETPEGFTVQFYVKNFGQTPAYRVTHSIHYSLQPDPLTIPINFPSSPKEYSASYVLPPNDKINVNLSFNVREEHLAMIFAGSAVIYFVGEVNYTDAFGKLRITHFRYVWRRGKELLLTEEGNEAT